ncbi:MAG: hypothetical protein AMXMBFR7_48300 [Planctomycetota bacterium]
MSDPASAAPSEPLEPATPGDPAPEAAPAAAPTEAGPRIALLGEAWVVAGVAQTLLDRDFRVRVLVPDETTAEALKGVKASADALEVLRGSPERSEDLHKLCQDARGVALLAPIELNGRRWRRERHLDELKALIAAGEACKVERIVYLSTVAADSKSRVPCLREAVQAELLTQDAHIADFVLRAAPLMGPGDGLVGPALNAARQGSPFMLVWGYGDTALQPLHIEDLGRCVARCFTRSLDDLRPGVYAVAGQEAMTHLELLDRVIEAERRFKVKVHLPLFMLRLAQWAGGGVGTPFGERVALLTAPFYAERNDAPKMLGPHAQLKSLAQTRQELAPTA